MKWLVPFPGQRILARLYLYALVCSLLVAGATIAGVAVLEPEGEAELRPEQRAALTWIAEGILTEASQPERLNGALATLTERFPVSFTIFGSDGRVLASTGPGVAVQRALDAGALSRLMSEHVLALSPRIIAVAGASDATGPAYVVANWERRGPDLGHQVLRTAELSVISLVVLGFALVPIARAIARPFERLANVTHAFGLGNLRARAEASETDRRDEVGVLSRAINQMADRLETLRRTEKELIANVSHELRTPLARIRVVVELASEEEELEMVKRRLGDIAEDLTEVEQILTDIIATARLDLMNERADGPYPPLRLARVRLDALVHSLAKRFQQQHATRPLQVFADEHVTLIADRIMLKHAISNLLDNAEKYSQEGSAIELHMQRRADTDEVLVVVSDHGHGIHEEDLPRVFSPFFRADRSRTRGTGGLGLGLTLAKRIVEAHGGRITLASRLDQGTTVTVAIPLELPSRGSVDEVDADT
jgi:signal transduction histidine kinase